MEVSQKVIEKGERLFKQDRVTVVLERPEGMGFIVKGDSGDHLVVVSKDSLNADTCTCKWNTFHDSPICSHRYAARLVAWGRDAAYRLAS